MSWPFMVNGTQYRQITPNIYTSRYVCMYSKALWVSLAGACTDRQKERGGAGLWRMPCNVPDIPPSLPRSRKFIPAPLPLQMFNKSKGKKCTASGMYVENPSNWPPCGKESKGIHSFIHSLVLSGRGEKDQYIFSSPACSLRPSVHQHSFSRINFQYFFFSLCSFWCCCCYYRYWVKTLASVILLYFLSITSSHTRGIFIWSSW